MPDRCTVRVTGRAWPDRLNRSYPGTVAARVHIKATVTLVHNDTPDLWAVEHDGTVIGQLVRAWPATRTTPTWRSNIPSGAGRRPVGTWSARRNDALCALLGEVGAGIAEAGETR